jgi:hypothetical protein
MIAAEKCGAQGVSRGAQNIGFPLQVAGARGGQRGDAHSGARMTGIHAPCVQTGEERKLFISASRESLVHHSAACCCDPGSTFLHGHPVDVRSPPYRRGRRHQDSPRTVLPDPVSVRLQPFCPPQTSVHRGCPPGELPLATVAGATRSVLRLPGAGPTSLRERHARQRGDEGGRATLPTSGLLRTKRGNALRAVVKVPLHSAVAL